MNWGKIWITFVTFYDQLWTSTPRYHKIFDFSLLEWRVVKKRARGFWLRFYFLRNWPISHFCFPWIAGTLLLSGYFLKCTPLLKELRQIFFELELQQCTLTENLLKRLILFHWYCNSNPPARLNDVNICGMRYVLAKMSVLSICSLFEDFDTF